MVNARKYEFKPYQRLKYSRFSSFNCVGTANKLWFCVFFLRLECFTYILVIRALEAHTWILWCRWNRNRKRILFWSHPFPFLCICCLSLGRQMRTVVFLRWGNSETNKKDDAEILLRSSSDLTYILNFWIKRRWLFF